jgi:hypothetical protein
MPEKKKGILAIKKANKPTLAPKELPSTWNKQFGRWLDTFREEFGGFLWDPFRGFE